VRCESSGTVDGSVIRGNSEEGVGGLGALVSPIRSGPSLATAIESPIWEEIGP
jgi:hypothetical protein